MDQKLDVTDLIPKGLGIYWAVFLGGAAVVGLLEFAYLNVPLLCEKFGLRSIPPLDLAFQGSLLNWFVSLLFILSALVSLLNFRLGMKYGDPKPRVAAWFWTAFALLFLSMDTQVAFRETFRDLLIAVSGTTIHEDGTVWWLAVYVFVFGLIGTRILADMIAYLPSLGLFLLATLGAVLGLSLKFLPNSMDPIRIAMLQSGLKSAAVLLYFLAFTLFARRQVFRDPEVALQWFAKVWNQTPILQTVQKLQTTPATPTPKDSPKPQPAPAASTKPQPSSTASGVIVPTAGTASGITRPLVQKPTETVSFKNAGATRKDDDFEVLVGG